MKWSRLAVPAALVACLPVAACSTDDGAEGSVEIVASFYPLAFVAEQVAGDRADVVLLTEPGQEPHDLELSPVQVGQVQTADLVVYEAGLQTSVDSAVDQAGQVPTVNASEIADLKTLDGGDVDPHFWHDPTRMAIVADAVAGQLAQLDPDNAATYQANATALDSDLDDLDQEFRDGLASCAVTDVVVSHDAFGYLSKYQLTFHGIAGLSPDAEPTPADLADLADLISQTSITTVFSERLVSPALAETLASEMGITTAVLDPIEGLSDQTADEDYFSLMRDNLAALQEANQCQ
ncbi:MAG: metal ABC transporter substrate-binding protein [Nocardioides sp.]